MDLYIYIYICISRIWWIYIYILNLSEGIRGRRVLLLERTWLFSLRILPPSLRLEALTQTFPFHLLGTVGIISKDVRTGPCVKSRDTLHLSKALSHVSTWNSKSIRWTQTASRAARLALACTGTPRAPTFSFPLSFPEQFESGSHHWSRGFGRCTQSVRYLTNVSFANICVLGNCVSKMRIYMYISGHWKRVPPVIYTGERNTPSRVPVCVGLDAALASAPSTALFARGGAACADGALSTRLAVQKNATRVERERDGPFSSKSSEKRGPSFSKSERKVPLRPPRSTTPRP